MKLTRAMIITLILAMAVGLGGCTTVSPPAAPLAPTPSPPTPTPPSTPSNLTADAVSQTQVILHWIDNSDNEDGFRIYRDGNIVGTVSPNSTTYQETGLEAGKTYHFVVKAYNVAGESGAGSCIVKTPNPPLNITVNYIGVKFDHDPMDIQGPGDIRLVLVVSDGIQTVQEIIPPGEGTFSLNDYETIELNQRIFHTAVVGEYLKVGIIAYDDDPETLVSDILQAALPVVGAIIGLPDISSISAIFSAYEEETGKPLFENKDDYVGYFEGFWGSDESWGIGQHNTVGTGDFRVWLSIWSDNQPPPMPKPTLSPGIAIQNVDAPSEVEVGKVYTHTITLRNNESRSVAVLLKVHSSVTGDVESKFVTVPANGSIDVTDRIKYEPAGVRIMTYTILYKGRELDSWSGSVEAKSPPLPSVHEVLSVNFDGWYVDGSKVNTTTKDKTVTGRITLSGGDPGQYKMRIRRDIRWADDETVNELSFSYDGVSATKELSFTPPYATDEASTDGYHIDLIKDGYKVWTLIDAYPPRLRVTIAESALPNVTIQSIGLPAEVEVGKVYDYLIALRNNESRSVTVTLKIHSSVTGDLSSKSVTVPANVTKHVTEQIKFQPAGVRTMTYTILYDGQELDSLSKTVEAK